MRAFPMQYMGVEIRSKRGLFGMLKLVGQRLRAETGGNREGASKLIRFAHEGGWISAIECSAFHALIGTDTALANSVGIQKC